MSVEKKRFECSALPKGWQREEVIRKSGLSAGKVDVCYYSPEGQKFESKPQLVRAISDSVDLTTFDFSTGKCNSLLARRHKKPRTSQFDYSSRESAAVFSFPRDPARRRDWLRAIGRKDYSISRTSVVCARHFDERYIVREDRAVRTDGSVLTVARARLKLTPQATPTRFLGAVRSPPPLQPATPEQLRAKSQARITDPLYFRGVRNDASLVPPIRQTASIFKQPVTVYRTQEGKVKSDFKHGPQEKPKQLFWEKRLEGLRASDISGNPLEAMELPRALKPAGPGIGDETLLQSVATALHVLGSPITGQAGLKDRDPAVFINPDQPLMQAVSVTDEDIKKQEERVNLARKKLQEFMKDIES